MGEGSLQKSAKQSVESTKVVEMGILIFWHVEDDLPELWDLYRCAVAVGASDVEAWRAWRRKLANSLYGEDSYE